MTQLRPAACSVWTSRQHVILVENPDRYPAATQPNILDEYVKERGLEAAATAAKLTAPDDALVLEDEKARMVLRGDDGALPLATLVTGALVESLVRLSNLSCALHVVAIVASLCPLQRKRFCFRWPSQAKQRMRRP